MAGVPGGFEFVGFGADRVPAAAEGGHDDGFDDAEDVVFAGVVGAELGAGAGVEGALEEGAEDGGLDGGPVEAGGLGEGGEFVCGEGDDVDGAEEAAVEAVEGGVAVVAAVAHGVEEVGDAGGEAVGVGDRVAEEVGEEAAGEEADVFGEEAEEELDEEVGGAVGGDIAGAQGGGDLAEALGGLTGDDLGADVRLEGVRVGPDGLEDGEVVGEVEVVEGEGVALGFGAGEVGGDDDAVEVAGDEEGRVFEVVLVADELAVGGVEVLVRALVLPGEVVAVPDVGEAFAAAELFGAALEGVEVAGGVGLDGGGDAEGVAEVGEVGLGGGAFGEGDPAPAGWNAWMVRVVDMGGSIRGGEAGRRGGEQPHSYPLST